MKAIILDVITGRKMAVDGPRSWEWAENNYSCDCNRNVFRNLDTVHNSMDGEPDGICKGHKRFLVVNAIMDHEDDCEYTLDELNSEYPKSLRERFLGNAERIT